MQNLPLTFEEFARLLESFPGGIKSFAAAVSGGPDSMALAFHLKRWAEDNSAEMMAFIVDHKLRPESSAEADLVKKRLLEHGIKTEIICWEHEKILSKIHVKAREARYRLLLQACKERGIENLFFAHHRDDQAETILMRFAKGSGIEGLAGMDRISFKDGIRIMRPLLFVPKERLIATCEKFGIEYVTDPSNEKEMYARGRLRRVMPLLAQEGFDSERLIDLGERAREAKDAINHYARAFLRVASRMDIAGSIHIDLEHLRSCPKAVGLKALSVCMQSLNKGDYYPERKAILPLYERLVSDNPMQAQTLHGCYVTKGSKNLIITREYASIVDVKHVKPGETVVWDGRWQVKLSSSFGWESLCVRALGFAGREEIDRLYPDLRRKVQRGRARAALPAVWQDNRLIAIPDLEEWENAAVSAMVVNMPADLL